MSPENLKAKHSSILSLLPPQSGVLLFVFWKTLHLLQPNASTLLHTLLKGVLGCGWSEALRAAAALTATQ